MTGITPGTGGTTAGWEAFHPTAPVKPAKSERTGTVLDQYRVQGVDLELSGEAAREGFEDLGRALEIARRMMHGDIVPASDEKFLMDFNRDIYMGAKNMQALAKNDDPEKYDSLLEDEEGEGASVAAHGSDITVDASGLNLCQPNME